VSQPDQTPGAEAHDEDEGYEDEVPPCADGDGPAPAASLTSIRLTRRRRPAKAPRPTPRQRPEPVTRAAPADPETRRDDRGGQAPGTDKGEGTEQATAAAQSDSAIRSEPADRRRPAKIVDYWSRLRGERAYPCPSELDGALITATWPNAMLLRRHDGETGLRAAALYKPEAAPGSTSDHTLDLSPMVVEWILSLAERTVRGGQPILEQESFERPKGSVRYAACALPFSETQGEVDHVLCHLRLLS